MTASVDFTIAFDRPDEDGWIVARVLEVPGALSQGRTREEARENVLDALQTVLTPDEELTGEVAAADRGALAVYCRGVKRRDLERHLLPPRLPRDRRLKARQVAWPTKSGLRATAT